MGMSIFIAMNVSVSALVARRRGEQKKKEAMQPDFAEEVSQRVIEKLEPRFIEIERNLDKDKNRLDNHEFVISRIQENQKDTREGLVAICKYLMAMTQYGHIGENNEHMKKAVDEMTQYLATKIGG